MRNMEQHEANEIVACEKEAPSCATMATPLSWVSLLRRRTTVIDIAISYQSGQKKNVRVTTLRVRLVAHGK